MLQTPNINLPILQSGDKYLKETQNEAFRTIDTEIRGLSEAVRSLDNVDGSIIETREQLEDVIASISNKETYVTPEMFGALGDGDSDDAQKLYDMHMYANSKNINVVYGSKTYKIASALDIPIRTNVDFSNCKLIIDESCYSNKYIYEIPSTKTKVIKTLTTSEKSEIVSSLYKNQYPTIFKDYKNSFLILQSEDVFARREGGSGITPTTVYKSDLFYVNESGYVTGEIAWKLTKPTNIVIVDGENNYITIKGCEITVNGAMASVPVGYYAGGFIRSRRSKVNIDGFVVKLEEGATMTNQYVQNGFFCIVENYGTTLSNISNICRRHDPSVNRGTYAYSYNTCMNITFDNCSAVGKRDYYWGATVGYNCKNLVFKNCVLNRYDVHNWVHNLTAENCETYYESFNVTGTGKLLIKNCHMYDDSASAKSFLNTRIDYSSYVDMDIEIINCSMTTSSVDIGSACIYKYDIDTSYDGQNDKIMAKSITIDGFKFITSSANTICFGIVCDTLASAVQGGRKIVIPSNVKINNVSVNRNNKMILIRLQKINSYNCYARGIWEVSNTVFNTLESTAPNTSAEQNIDISGGLVYSDNAPNIDFIFNNCKNVNVSLRGITGDNITFNNCTVNNTGYGNGTNDKITEANITYNNNVFEATLVDAVKTSTFLQSTAKTTYNSCYYKTPIVNGTSSTANVSNIYGLLNGTTVMYVVGNHMFTRFSQSIVDSTCFVKGNITTQASAISKFKFSSHGERVVV